MMLTYLHIFSIFFILFGVTSSFSLLDRVHKKDVRTSIPDFRTSDADVGMRSAHFIGSFRGKPIRTRQHHAFIDDNGVPIPILPFADFSAEEHHHASKLNKIRKMIDQLQTRAVQ